jgi:hypothetical protein
MRGFTGGVWVERLREEHGAIASDPMQLLQENSCAPPTAEQAEVVAEHDDGIE